MIVSVSNDRWESHCKPAVGSVNVGDQAVMRAVSSYGLSSVLRDQIGPVALEQFSGIGIATQSGIVVRVGLNVINCIKNYHSVRRVVLESSLLLAENESL